MSAQSRTVRALRGIPAAAKSSPTLAIAGPAHARTTGTSQHVASRLSGRHDDAGNALSAMAGSAAEQGSLAAGVCEFVHARVYVRFSVGPANDSLHANLGDWSQNDAARPDALHALVEAEDDLIAAHRQHIEESMACVREEMNLLGELEGSTGTNEVHRYAQALAGLLHRKAAAVASLQQRLEQFRAQMGSGAAAV